MSILKFLRIGRASFRSDSGGATTSPRRPVRQEAVAARDVRGAAPVIEEARGVPVYYSVMSIGGDAPITLAKDVQSSFIVLDTGGNRGAILYDPDSRDVRAILGHIKAQMALRGIELPAGSVHAARGRVIERLIKDHVAKHGASGGDQRRQESAAMQRFKHWFEVAVREGATDIHIQCVGSNRAEVQIRVHGQLEPFPDPTGVCTELEAREAMAWPMNSGAEAGSNSVSQWDGNKDSYCMTKPILVDNKKVALRYQSLRGHKGPKVVARLLDVDTDAPTRSYQELGFEASHEEMLFDAAHARSGVFMLAGTTGSGKTTTIKTFLESHPGNGSLAMYSLEDPVEYPLRNVHQISFQRDLANPAESARKFSEAVASQMRADLDLAFIGEIRDAASAMAAQSIQESGHMAIGTVHANFLSGIVPRVSSSQIGLSRMLLTNPKVIALMAYQALVPVLCSCSVDSKAAIEHAREVDRARGGLALFEHRLRTLLQSAEDRLKVDSALFRFRNHTGCPACKGRGIIGQTVVAEMLIPDREWLALTRDGHDHRAVDHYRSMSDGRFDTANMNGKTAFEHALFKALHQRIDPRECENFDSFARFTVRG